MCVRRRRRRRTPGRANATMKTVRCYLKKRNAYMERRDRLWSRVQWAGSQRPFNSFFFFFSLSLSLSLFFPLIFIIIFVVVVCPPECAGASRCVCFSFSRLCLSFFLSFFLSLRVYLFLFFPYRYRSIIYLSASPSRRGSGFIQPLSKPSPAVAMTTFAQANLYKYPYK